METLKAIFTDQVLRGRIIFVLAILAVTRVIATIPIPGVSTENLASALDNAFLSYFNLFSGGGLSAFSIAMLGVGPYITASIIMQLMTVLVPKLKEMQQEDGDAGRRRFVQYGRLLSVPLAVLQGYALIALLVKQQAIPPMEGSILFANIIIVTAGSMLMMWLGEQINEYGIGNGISLIIFAGIVAMLPTTVSQLFVTFTAGQIPILILVTALLIVVIGLIVYVSEAERPIPVTYAKQARLGASSTGYGADTYIPIRLNQAGVVPIIFAVSILIFPQMIASLLQYSSLVTLQSIARSMNDALANQWIYGGLYFLLVVMFTYFYTAVTFDPEKTASNISKSGGFIPGFRPGEATVNYIGDVVSKITLVGALFLGVVAVLPVIVQNVTGIASIAVGGTSLLIAITVVLDLIKKIDAQLSMREY